MSREVDIKLPSFPIFGVLTIVLIVLKLVEVIDISWWWIVASFFAPLIIYVGVFLGLGALALAAVGIAFVGALILDGFEKLHRMNRRRKFGLRK